jgi:hypothetical protein
VRVVEAPWRVTTDGLYASIARYGWEAASFLALEPGIEVWTDPTTGALVPYSDTGGAWVGVGLPLAPAAELAAVALRFAAAAGAAGRRASLFSVERRLDGFPALLVGEQPEWAPRRWPRVVQGSRGLREQLRRARAGGVRVRAASADELDRGAPLRATVEALGERWLARQHMEPMHFLVTLAPWQRPREHRYFVAFRGAELVAFLSVVPIPARRGWLFEDLLRAPGAPNGTSEALIDLAMRSLADEGAEVATLGLAPLAGRVPRWLRVARVVGRGLYDFRGLRAFKARLHPEDWRPVWLLAPPGARPAVCLLDALRAFVGKRVARFVLRTVFRHPSAACIALALPLVPWTLALALLAVLGAHGPLGYSRGALGAWSVFDAGLDAALWWSALRPRRWALAGLAAVASCDAVASTVRLADVGFGGRLATIVLRAAAVAAPIFGSSLLWWSAVRDRLRYWRSNRHD